MWGVWDQIPAPPDPAFGAWCQWGAGTIGSRSFSAPNLRRGEGGYLAAIITDLLLRVEWEVTEEDLGRWAVLVLFP